MRLSVGNVDAGIGGQSVVLHQGTQAVASLAAQSTGEAGRIEQSGRFEDGQFAVEEVPVDADVVADEVDAVDELRDVAAAPDNTARRFGGYLQTEWKDGFAMARLFIRGDTLIEHQPAIAWSPAPA
jgi:hypothetical protein